MSLTVRLSLLQFLQNAVFGTTVISLGTYMLETLQFNGREVGLVYATGAIAASLAPPLTGWLADRHFSLDRMLVVLSLASAALLIACFYAISFPLFYGLILAFNLCFMPTFSLLSSVCFHQLKDPSQSFPFVRMWGTVGFIVVGITLSLLAWEASPWPLIAGAGMTLCLGLLALSLPAIPPQPGFSFADLKGEEVKNIIREPGMIILMLAMFFSCIPSSFYYSFVNPFLNEVGWEAAAAKMSLGQVGEVGILLAAPFALRTFRFRTVVFWGLFLWGARYFAFAYGRPDNLEGLLYLGIIVQGFVFVWIVVAAQIYVDNRVPKKLRSTAQGLISFANQGIGMILGSWIAGEVVNANLQASGLHDWTTIWWIPGVVGVVAAVGFLAFFPREGRVG